MPSIARLTDGLIVTLVQRLRAYTQRWEDDMYETKLTGMPGQVARPRVYTNALPPISLVWILETMLAVKAWRGVWSGDAHLD